MPDEKTASSYEQGQQWRSQGTADLQAKTTIGNFVVEVDLDWGTAHDRHLYQRRMVLPVDLVMAAIQFEQQHSHVADGMHWFMLSEGEWTQKFPPFLIELPAPGLQLDREYSVSSFQSISSFKSVSSFPSAQDGVVLYVPERVMAYGDNLVLVTSNLYQIYDYRHIYEGGFPEVVKRTRAAMEAEGWVDVTNASRGVHV